jgi:hypothetical protein
MFKILNLFNKKPELEGLEGFVDNIHSEKEISIECLRENVSRGLVEIYKIKPFKKEGDDRQYLNIIKSQGLLLTDNGYIITCLHGIDCLDNEQRVTKIATICGMFDLEKVCKTDEEHDIALIKANINGCDSSRQYVVKKDFTEGGLKKYYSFPRSRDEPCESSNPADRRCTYFMKDHHQMTRKPDGKISLVCNQLLFVGDVEHGNSGSPVISEDGELTGIITSGNDGGFTFSATPITKALDLITVYILEEKQKI